MSFLNPFGWLLAIGFPIVYMLSKNNKKQLRIDLPSIDIWRQIEAESLQQQTKKWSPSVLLAIQLVIVGCVVIGDIDMYKTFSTTDDVITLIYDDSFSTERITSKEPLLEFIEANKEKNFKVLFVNETLTEEGQLLTAKEAEKLLESRVPSRNALDVSLLTNTYYQLESNGNSVVVFTDKVLATIASLELLPVDESNVGLRHVSYNPMDETITISIENDGVAIQLVPLEIYVGQDLVYEEQLYIEGGQIKCHKIISEQLKNNGLLSISMHDTPLLTVKLAVNDSLLSDNKYTIPFIQSIDVATDMDDENLAKVMTLLPYVTLSKNGVPLMDLAIPASSAVLYDDTFLDAVSTGTLFSKETTKSPYFPLWIEDHAKATYEREVNREIKTLIEKPLPSNYRINTMGHKQSEVVNNGHKKEMIHPELIILLVFGFILLEEEVRKRV